MNEVIIKVPSDLNINYLVEAANDVLVHSKDDIAYFESLRNKKWYNYLFEKITFNRDNELRKAKGVLNIAKMQDIIIKILLQLSESRNEIYTYITNHSSCIEQLSQTNQYVQKQQKSIIAILKQIKNRESCIPKYQDLTSENADTIFATLQKFAQEKPLQEKNNKMTRRYLCAVRMCSPVNPSFDFDNLDVIENLGVQIRQRLAIMLYEYMYLADADDTIESDVLGRISPHLKQVAKDSVTKSIKLMGKDVLIQQYQMIEMVDTISDEGIIYASSCDKGADKQFHVEANYLSYKDRLKSEILVQAEGVKADCLSYKDRLKSIQGTIQETLDTLDKISKINKEMQESFASRSKKVSNYRVKTDVVIEKMDKVANAFGNFARIVNRARGIDVDTVDTTVSTYRVYIPKK